MKQLCLMCAVLFGVAGVSSAADEAATIQEEAETSGLSLEAQITVPSSYVFRGYVIEDDHFIVQPEFTATYETQVGDLSIAPYFTAWANLTDLSAPGDPEWFNELDLTLGTDIDLTHGFSLGLIYNYYNSPANFFDDIHEVGITLSHDCFINPSIGLFREIHNESNDENTYIELSIEPALHDVPIMDRLVLSLPIVVGLSPDEYFTDSDGDGSVFGFASIGIAGEYTFCEQWSLLAGVDYIQMLSDSTEESNDGDEYKIVGRIGVKYSH